MVASAVDQRVAVLAFDRDQARGAKQQMVDLAAPVAVAPDQRPFVSQNAAEPAGHQLLTFDAGHQDFLLVGQRPGGTRRFGGVPPHPAYGKDAAEPRPPPVPGTGRIPCLLSLPDLIPMLREGSLVSGRTPVVPVGPQPDLPEQGPRMIRQLHDPHAHPVPQAAQAMYAVVVSPGQPGVSARPAESLRGNRLPTHQRGRAARPDLPRALVIPPQCRQAWPTRQPGGRPGARSQVRYRSRPAGWLSWPRAGQGDGWDRACPCTGPQAP